MPVEQVGEQPHRLLLLGPLLGRLRHPGQQARRQLAGAALALAHPLARIPGLVERSWNLGAARLGLGAQGLEPVAQGPRRETILPVVGRDDRRVLVIHGDRRSQLQATLDHAQRVNELFPELVGAPAIEGERGERPERIHVAHHLAVLHIPGPVQAVLFAKVLFYSGGELFFPAVEVAGGQAHQHPRERDDD